LTVVTVGSKVSVTGKGSAFMVVTFRVEVFFDVDQFRFGHFLVIVSTLVLLTLFLRVGGDS